MDKKLYKIKVAESFSNINMSLYVILCAEDIMSKCFHAHFTTGKGVETLNDFVSGNTTYGQTLEVIKASI